MAKLTKKEAAANARKRRLTRIYAKEYTELLKKQMAHKKSEEKIITFQNVQARIARAQKELKLAGRTATRAAAIKAVEYSTTFMSNEEMYMKAIRDYMSVADRNKVRYYLAEINGTKYRNTSINWNEFTYVSATQSMVHISGKLSIKIRHGKNSTEPDFIEISKI